MKLKLFILIFLATCQAYLYDEALGGEGIQEHDHNGEDDKEFCVSKADGNYPAGICLDIYIKCRREKLKVLKCRRSDEVYSEKFHRCVHVTDMPSCLGFDFDVRDDNSRDSPSICNKFPDETVLQLWPCHSSFGYCESGHLKQLKCMPGKVFDQIRQKCVRPEMNTECPSLKSNVLSKYCHLYTTRKLNRKLLIPYGECTNQLLDCSQEPPQLIKCELDRIFDQQQHRCVASVQVAGCHPSNQWQLHESSDRYRSSEIRNLNQMTMTIALDIDFCDNKPLGIYYKIEHNERCATSFRLCNKTNESYYKFECKSGYYFDEHFISCTKRSECEFEKFEFINDDQKIDTSICRTINDGIYPIDQTQSIICDERFVLCKDHTAYVLTCEEGTFFEPNSGVCISKEHYGPCSIFQNNRFLTNKHVPISVIFPTNLCLTGHSRNGVYAFTTCENVYIKCTSGGQPVVQYCNSPSETFDSIFGRCVPKWSHPSCPEYVAAFNQAGIYQRHQNQGLPISQHQIRSPEFLYIHCSLNGQFKAHPYSCKKFLRCDHTKWVEFDCPVGTVFVPAILVCDHARNYKPCR